MQESLCSFHYREMQMESSVQALRSGREMSEARGYRSLEDLLADLDIMTEFYRQLLELVDITSRFGEMYRILTKRSPKNSPSYLQILVS